MVSIENTSKEDNKKDNLFEHLLSFNFDEPFSKKVVIEELYENIDAGLSLPLLPVTKDESLLQNKPSSNRNVIILGHKKKLRNKFKRVDTQKHNGVCKKKKKYSKININKKIKSVIHFKVDYENNHKLKRHETLKNSDNEAIHERDKYGNNHKLKLNRHDTSKNSNNGAIRAKDNYSISIVNKIQNQTNGVNNEATHTENKCILGHDQVFSISVADQDNKQKNDDDEVTDKDGKTFSKTLVNMNVDKKNDLMNLTINHENNQKLGPNQMVSIVDQEIEKKYTNDESLLVKLLRAESQPSEQPNLLKKNDERQVSSNLETQKENKLKFPRTKVTSRRNVKKYPGKLDAMKKHMENSAQGCQEELLISTKSVSTLNNLRQSKEISQPVLNNGSAMDDSEMSKAGTNGPFCRLMNTVAENLLTIFPALQNHLLFTGSNKCNNENSMKAKENFERIKFHCFCLSYSTVVSLILPQKENEMFVKKFCNLATKLAKHNKINGYSEKKLRILFFEMINWTEHKKKNMDNFYNTYNRKQANISSEQSQASKNRINQYINDAASLNTSLNSSTDLPLSLSFSTDQHRTETQMVNNRNTPAMAEQSQRVSSHAPTSCELSARIESNMNSIYFAQHQQSVAVSAPKQYTTENVNLINARNSSIAKTSSHHQEIASTSALPYYHQQLYSRPKLPTYMESIYNSFATNHSQNRPNSVYPPHSIPAQYYPHQNQIQLNQENSQNVQNEALPVNQYTITRRLSSTPVLERSSISRDSGFTSPFSDTALAEPFLDNPANVNMTPMITHVTSMNPNALQSPYSYCKMCRRMTNLTCVGCNSSYYCSPECQTLDWQSHRLICKNNGEINVI